MVTTAYRSVLAMRKAGYYSETTEHKLGGFVRKDLFGCFDGIAVREGEIIFFQSYHKKEEKNHSWLDSNHMFVRVIRSTGCKVEHHLHSFKTKNGRKYWSMERREVK